MKQIEAKEALAMAVLDDYGMLWHAIAPQERSTPEDISRSLVIIRNELKDPAGPRVYFLQLAIIFQAISTGQKLLFL